MRQTDEFSFRLGVSAIHGIGVFANHDIDAGTRLVLFDGETRFLAEAPSEAARRLLQVHGVEGDDGKGYYCPRSFTCVDVGWFLNHSDRPNARHTDWEYFALAPIREGEEVTIDYRTLGESTTPAYCGYGRIGSVPSQMMSRKAV
ncbi:MAG: SET domain-containing protein [Gammaproteobacteria bacterium]|nr:SET domain-containing protein [Acidobacteriota bacterium]MBM4225876.1 SET domain-containing protein [Gammaproteobacteria bacterium]